MQPNLGRTSPQNWRSDDAVAPPRSSEKPTIRSDVRDAALIPFVYAYIRGLPAQVEQLEEMLADEDIKSLSVLAHNFKGSGGLYGLMPISHAAADVEALIHSQASLDDISSNVRAKIAIVCRVEGY